MKTKDIMTTNVVTVNEKASLIDAQRIMEAHRIRRLPVMKRDKLVGLVTKHKLLEVAPSPATSLSKWELNYLLDELTVKEIMVKNPYTVSPDTPVEEALRMGQEKGYGVFPVVEDGRLVGVVTESDIVRLMTEALGVTEKGTHLEIKIPHMNGNMQKILKVLDQNKIGLLSLVTFDGIEDGGATIALRLEKEDTKPIAKQLESSGFTISYAG